MENHNKTCFVFYATTKKNKKKDLKQIENTVQKILDIISSPSWIWPENFINITGDSLIGKTMWEEPS